MGTAVLMGMGAKRAPIPPSAWYMPAAAIALPAKMYTARTPVRNQGGQGACTGFGFGSGLNILHREGFLAAAGAIYYVNRKMSGFPANSDTGAFMEPSVRGLIEVGAGPESLHPYTEPFQREPSGEYYAAAADHRVKNFYRAVTVVAAKTALANGLPVVTSFDVPASFSDVGATGMWVDRGGRAVGGHAVVFVGYDDDKTYGSSGAAKGCFLVQNSWGTNWGTNHPADAPGSSNEGFFWLPYAAFEGTRWWDGFVITTWDLEAGA